MLEDHELFTQLCEKRGIVPPLEILNAIKFSSSSGELRLSCLSIMIPVCEVIAQMLATSSSIRIVDLSDCMLLSKGLGFILNALCDGSSVTSLNLKGNNINGATVSQLGQIFLHNNTLKCLHIEWNSLGSHIDTFAKFCDGLAKNHNVEELDLRYNQISPYCAEPLSKAIRWNKSLRNLDLAWNTLGLQGGQQILSAMQDNKSITAIGLRGNCIPEEIVQKIEGCASRNRSNRFSKSALSKNMGKLLINKSRSSHFSSMDSTMQDLNESELRYTILLSDADIKRASILSPKRHSTILEADEINVESSEKHSLSSDNENQKSVKTRKRKKRKERNQIKVLHLSSALTKNKKTDPESDSKESEYVDLELGSMTNITIAEDPRRTQVNAKIEELNQILLERSKVIDALTVEVAAKTNEAETYQSQISELQLEISKLKEERGNFEVAKAKEIEEILRKHKESQENWEELKTKLESAYQQCLQSKKEIEQKIRKYEKEIHKQSVESAMLKDKFISNVQAYEDLLSKDKTEMHRLRMELKERENRNKIDQNILKTTLKETTQALEECQGQLQKSRNELRDLNENYSILKLKLSDNEHTLLRYTRLEETLQKVKEEKEELAEKFVDSHRLSTALQRQVSTLQSELIEPQRRYELLKEELDQEKENSSRFKQELSDERNRIKEQNIQIEKLTQQINSFSLQINEMQNKHSDTLRDRDKEKNELKQLISNKEKELAEFRAEEVQRATQLYAAFNKYLGAIGGPGLPL